MRRVLYALAVATVLLLGGALVVLAQGGAVSLLQPVVVTVNQAVPVNVTLGGVVNGQAVTLTAPMTMAIAVQVRLEGRGASVVAAQAAPAGTAPAAQGGVLRDLRGVQYKVDVRPPFELTQVGSTVSPVGWISVVGEVKNTGTVPLRYVKGIVTFYKDGKIVQVGEGYTKLDVLEPGQSAPFETILPLPADQVNAYTVQVQGREAK